MVSNWNPPRKRITVIRDGQPEVGSPNTRVRITIKTIIIKAKIQDNSPPIKAMFKGGSEKLTIPPIEYLKRDQNSKRSLRPLLDIFIFESTQSQIQPKQKFLLKIDYTQITREWHRPWDDASNENHAPVNHFHLANMIDQFIKHPCKERTNRWFPSRVTRRVPTQSRFD